MAIKPLRDYVLIKQIESEEKTKSGIYLPDTAKEKPQEGEVVAAGKGRILEDGTIKPLEIKEGDKILFAKYSGAKIRYKDEDFLIIKEDDILAIISKK